VVTWGFTNIDDFARFLKLFEEILMRNEAKLMGIEQF